MSDAPFGLRGGIDKEKQRICVWGQMGPDQQRVTTLHEILHAAMDQAVRHLEEEETFITAIAPALIDVLRRNPALVDYLLS